MDSVVGSLVDKLSSLILINIKEGPRAFWFYVEAQSNLIAPTLMQDFGDYAVYKRELSLNDLVLDIWNAAEKAGQRWDALLLDILNDKFTAQFRYGLDLDNEDEHISDRSDAEIKARFGDKKIIYPPFPTEADKLRMLGAQDFTL